MGAVPAAPYNLHPSYRALFTESLPAMLQVKPGDALVDPWLMQHCWADERGDNLCQVFDYPPRNCTAGF